MYFSFDRFFPTVINLPMFLKVGSLLGTDGITIEGREKDIANLFYI